MEPPSGPDSPEEGSPCDLAQAFSRILHRLTGQQARRGDASEAALTELSALLEAPACERLLEGDGGVPAILGQVARALEKCAAPPKDEAGGGVAERAARVGLVFLKLLGKVGAARSSPGSPACRAGLRHLAAPIYVFAITHSAERPWSSPRSRHVAGEVLASLLGVTECGSVAGFLRGESEDDKGRFAGILGFLKADLNKESWKNNPATKHVFFWTLQQVTRPWLNQHLERVLPPSLLISDDYQTENKILGVHCLHHIVLNVVRNFCPLSSVLMGQTRLVPIHDITALFLLMLLSYELAF